MLHVEDFHNCVPPTIHIHQSFCFFQLRREESLLYLLEVDPLLWIGNILQGLYGHELCLVHARQIQVTLVDLP